MMKYINIDAEFMVKHKLTLEQAAFYNYLRESLSWASDVIVDEVSYKWVSRGKVINDIPYITDKTDTVYRWFNKLHELGLITYLKKDGKDLFKFQESVRSWNFYSDGNPTKLGQQSENGSDGNPTYSNINYDSNTITEVITKVDDFQNNGYQTLVSFYNDLFGRNAKGDAKSKRQFSARIKEGYTLEDFKTALQGAKENSYHREKNYEYITLEFITRSDKLEKFREFKPQRKETGEVMNNTEQRYWDLIKRIELQPRDNSRYTLEERRFIIEYQQYHDRFPPDERKLVQDTCSLTRAEIDQKNREEGWTN